MHLALPCASGSMHPVDIHPSAQVGLCAHCVCMPGCVCTCMCLTVHAHPESPTKARDTGPGRGVGVGQIQRARRREEGWDEKRGRSLLGITLIGPNPDPGKTSRPRRPPQGPRTDTQYAHAHTGGGAHILKPTLTAEGRAGLVAAGLRARRPGRQWPRCDVTAQPPPRALPLPHPQALRNCTSVLSGIS